MKTAKLFGFKQGFKMNVQEKLNFELKVADVEKKLPAQVRLQGRAP